MIVRFILSVITVVFIQHSSEPYCRWLFVNHLLSDSSDFTPYQEDRREMLFLWNEKYLNYRYMRLQRLSLLMLLFGILFCGTASAQRWAVGVDVADMVNLGTISIDGAVNKAYSQHREYLFDITPGLNVISSET